MNALTIAPRTSFLVLSPTLKGAVRASMPATYASPGDDAGFVVTAPYVPNQGAIDEAKAALAAAESSLAPVYRAAFRKWLLSLSGSVANAPGSREDFDTKFNSLAVAVADIPATAFTDETLAKAMRVFKFFPTGAELFGFFSDIAKPMRADVDAIRRIANFRYDTVASQGPSVATEDEKVQVAETVARLKADLSSKRSAAITDDKLRPIPRPLSDQHLLAEYERTANDPAQREEFRCLASTRLRMLRERLGIVEEMAHAAD